VGFECDWILPCSSVTCGGCDNAIELGFMCGIRPGWNYFVLRKRMDGGSSSEGIYGNVNHRNRPSENVCDFRARGHPLLYPRKGLRSRLITTARPLGFQIVNA
jgi:hypothetical protein